MEGYGTIISLIALPRMEKRELSYSHYQDGREGK